MTHSSLFHSSTFLCNPSSPLSLWLPQSRLYSLQIIYLFNRLTSPRVVLFILLMSQYTFLSGRRESQAILYYFWVITWEQVSIIIHYPCAHWGGEKMKNSWLFSASPLYVLRVGVYLGICTSISSSSHHGKLRIILCSQIYHRRD